ncbi:MAG: lytic polysaccharide monooxygenase [Bacteroidota bacterium]
MNAKSIIHSRLLLSSLLLALFCLPSQQVLAHGTVTSPASRVWTCFQENPETPQSPACIASIEGYGTQAFYDWNEVARMDANGMHQQIIPDGQLASAGRPDKYGGLDQVRDDWLATPVTPGPFTVTWTMNAPHETLYFDVYITKESWTPDQPLTWDALELLVRTGPRPSSTRDDIDVILPPRTGKHVIYSIWQRSLSPEAFYSTSDVDFGNDPGQNVAPIAAFAFDNGRCGGAEVALDASDTYDANRDSLTYTWDLGDGTTASGVTVSHTYSSQLTSATVTLLVSDGEFTDTIQQTITNLVPDPNCQLNDCPYGTPTAAPLPSLVSTYSHAHVLGEGGPDLSNVTNFAINWDLMNNGLYHMAVNTNNGAPAWYVNLGALATQSFNSPEPEITLTGTGFAELDGTYYVTIDSGNFVMVPVDRSFTIYISNSATAPPCGMGHDHSHGHSHRMEQPILPQTSSYVIYPNPAADFLTIRSESDMANSTITIIDVLGKEMKSVRIQEHISSRNIDISELKTGIYYVRIVDAAGLVSSERVYVK